MERRRKGGGGGAVVARAERRDEHPRFVLLGLMLIGGEGEAGHARGPGDRFVIVADEEAMWARDWGTLRTGISRVNLR